MQCSLQFFYENTFGSGCYRWNLTWRRSQASAASKNFYFIYVFRNTWMLRRPETSATCIVMRQCCRGFQEAIASVKNSRKIVIYFDIANFHFRVPEAVFLLSFYATSILFRHRQAALETKQGLFASQNRLVCNPKQPCFQCKEALFTGQTRLLFIIRTADMNLWNE